MPVLTISRSYGLYEEEILKQFADDHGMLIFSQELLVEVAREADIPLEEIQNTYDMEHFSSFKTFIRELLQGYGDDNNSGGTAYQTYMPEFYPLYYPFMNLSENRPVSESRRSYKDIMAKVITEIAARDNVILIGRGAQMILKDQPNCTHLRLVGQQDKKLVRIMQKEGLDEKEAASKMKSADKHRSAYMEYFYNVDNQDPALYHYTINIDLLSRERFYKFLTYLIK